MCLYICNPVNALHAGRCVLIMRLEVQSVSSLIFTVLRILQFNIPTMN